MNSAEELKILLSTPAALFLVMLLGSLASMLKQLSDARKNGSSASLGSYLAHLPETAGTIITNALGFLTLVVTDQLNFASALGIGYAANSAADLLRTGGRSASLANKQGGFARPLMLVPLTALAVLALGLQGCTTNATKPQDVISLACSPSDAYLIERCAEAVGDVYSVFQGRALEIVSDPVTPADVKLAIQKLDRELTPAVRTLLQTSLAYVQMRDLQDPNAAAERAKLALQLADVQPKVQTLPKL